MPDDSAVIVQAFSSSGPLLDNVRNILASYLCFIEGLKSRDTTYDSFGIVIAAVLVV